MRKTGHGIGKTAWRYAFAKQNNHRRASILISLGVCVSFIALVFVISYMNASQDQRLSDIKEIESFHLRIAVDGATPEALEAMLDPLLEVSGVQHAFVFADVPSIISDPSSGQSATVRLRGTSETLFENTPFAARTNKIYGDLKDGTTKSMVPSYQVMRELGLMLYQDVDVTVLKPGKTVRMVPATQECNVTGFFQTKLPEFNSQTVLMSLASIAPLATNSDYAIGLFLSAHFEDRQHSVVQQIQALYPHATIQTWQDLNGSLYAAMMLEKYLMYFVVGLMILIIITNLQNSTTRLMRSKIREIAVLRTLGYRKGDIRSIFVLQAMMISATGLVAGLAISLPTLHWFPQLVSFLDTLIFTITGSRVAYLQVPMQLSANVLELTLIALSVLGLSALFAWIGQRKVLTGNIMEILHDEN